MKIRFHICLLSVLLIFYSCSDENGITTPVTPDPGTDVVHLPVVVHVIHNGEAVGNGPNLSAERIKRQIEILNEDFRRKAGTRGYNNHPDGGDSKIEFILARQSPEGKPFDGINRVDASSVEVSALGYNQHHYAQYAYWDPESYINIWTMPLSASIECVFLGEATGPDTDLPGSQYLSLPKPGEPEGILINWAHFGESDIECHARYGRTLTHEMGHYLGLLHTWGDKNCETNDYVADTPAVDRPVFGRNAFTSCNGNKIMIGNYMNYSHDEVMNTFTKGQIARMHYVLGNHKGRKALISSAALDNP